MLILSVHEVPVAKMRAEQDGLTYVVEYLDGVTEHESLSPNLPVRKEPYTFEGLPEFLNSLLPDEQTRIQVAKAFGFDHDDSYRLLVQALGTHNIGHLKVSRGVDGFEEEPFDAIGMTPRNPELVATSVKVLEDPACHPELREAIARARGSIGVGGVFPKTVLRAREGRFLIKSYPEFERSGTKGDTAAALEEASLRAARYAGLKAPGAKAYGDMIVVRRFDTPGVKVHHLRDLTNDKDKYRGSYERLRNIVEEKAGREAAVEFTKHVLFAWALRDSDKHQENCALLEKDGQFSLAPLYDSMPSSLLGVGEDGLGLTVGFRKGNHGWNEIRQFTDGYLTEEELKGFVGRSVKGILELVVPVAKGLRDKLTQQLFYVSQVMEGKTTGMARKELAKVMSTKGDPTVYLHQGLPGAGTPLSHVPPSLTEDMDEEQPGMEI